jgi:AraC family transcriptional activator of mtrCDE
MSISPQEYLDNPDALSAVLAGMQLHAQVYLNADYCGSWALDTSGSRRIPFHLVGRGEAWLHCAEQPVRSLSSGDLVLFPRDDHHVVASSAQMPTEVEINAAANDGAGAVTQMICGFFEFRDKASWPLLDSLAPVIVMDLGELSVAPQARALIDLMVGELQREAPGHYAVVNQLAHLLFIQVIRQQIDSGRVQTGLLAALFDPRISVALRALHNQPGHRWTLAGLAQEAAMGRSAFARRFNELTHTTPMQYLSAWRMQEATRMLQSSKLSLADIAERCGYDSEPAFRKAFKNTTGRTPGAVRREG